MNHEISRIVIESAINKGLIELKTDLNRGIRNLVDLGDYFAKGRFQKDFFSIAQEMLANENSPYYQLISNIVNNVDDNIIKNFGINIGLNSWTKGAKIIRQHEKEYGYNVPWTIIFDLHGQVENRLTLSEILDTIKQGKEIGIYSYFFFTGFDSTQIDMLLKILEQNSDCAFLIFTYPNLLKSEHILDFKKYGNAVLSIYMDNLNLSSDFSQTIDILRKNKCLYGIHFSYNDYNTNVILSDNLLKHLESLNCVFAFLIKSEECSMENALEIKNYIKDAKTNQRYPVFLVDFYEDIAHIDCNISVESCFFKVLSDGSVYSSTSLFNVRNNSLVDIFSQTMPKVGYL